MCVFIPKIEVSGFADVLHVDHHGVLGLGALMPGLAFRSQVEAQPERPAQAGVHAVSSW